MSNTAIILNDELTGEKETQISYEELVGLQIARQGHEMALVANGGVFRIVSEEFRTRIVKFVFKKVELRTQRSTLPVVIKEKTFEDQDNLNSRLENSESMNVADFEE